MTTPRLGSFNVDVLAALLTGAVTARSNLGLSIGTTSGTVAAGNDSRIVGALQPAAIPGGTSGQLLAATGVSGISQILTLGANLLLSGTTLSVIPATPTANGISVWTYSADKTGVTDATVAFQNTQNATQAQGGGSILVPYGTYKLSASVYSVSNVSWLIDSGTKFIGTDNTTANAGQIVGQGDQMSGINGPTIIRFDNIAGASARGFWSSMFIGATGSNTGYEKAAIWASIITSDDAGTSNTKDAVGIQVIAANAGSLATSRIWGHDTIVRCVATSDAFLVGHEIAIENYGSNQPLIDKANTKVGLNIIPSGSVNSTAHILLNGGTALTQSADGIIGKDSAFSNNFIRLVTANGSNWIDLAKIDKLGNSTFVNGTYSGTLTAGIASLKALRVVATDWLATTTAYNLPWPTTGSNSAILSPNGQIAATFASRASDLSNAYGSLQTTIGVASFALNDDVFSTSARHVTVYGGYDEAQTLAGSSGLTFGREIDAVNFAGTPTQSTPGTPLVYGSTTALWLAAGGQHTGGFDVSMAIGIKDNLAKFQTGIIFGAAALTRYSGYSYALRLAQKHIVQWHDAADVEASFITSSMSVAANSHSLQFQDGGTILLNKTGGVIFTVAQVANAVNGIYIVPGASGVPIQITAQGADTNVGINLTPKGTGAVYTGSAVSCGSTLGVTGNASLGGNLYVTGVSSLTSISATGKIATTAGIAAFGVTPATTQPAIPSTISQAVAILQGAGLCASGTIAISSGSLTTLRVVTAAGSVTVLATDGVVVINKTAGAATLVTLEASPIAGTMHIIKDGKGDAVANPITVVPTSGTIDGQSSYVIALARASLAVVYTGTEWSII